jgi:transposase InsO family protein
MENFFSTLKIEVVYRTAWRTRDEAENAIFTYIDGWYNSQRIQARQGAVSPDEYEAAWHIIQAARHHPATVHPEPTGAR